LTPQNRSVRLRQKPIGAGMTIFESAKMRKPLSLVASIDMDGKSDPIMVYRGRVAFDFIPPL